MINVTLTPFILTPFIIYLQKQFIYNSENRLAEVKNGTGTTIASYRYDPFGRRLSKTASGTTTYYAYSQEGLIAEINSAGSITTSYGWQPDSTWSTDPLYIKQDSQFGYYHNDHLGTPQRIVSSSGQVLWSAAYDAFGEATVTQQQMTNNLRFAGQYFDSETGLHYNYYRYYDPTTGRYITSDPIGLAGGLNTYGYAEQNPIKLIDMFGLKSLCAALWEVLQTWADNPFINGSDFDMNNLAKETVPAGGGPRDLSNFRDDYDGLLYDIQYIQVGWSLRKTYGPGAATLAYHGYKLGPLFSLDADYFKGDNLEVNKRGLNLGVDGAKEFESFFEFVDDLCPEPGECEASP